MIQALRLDIARRWQGFDPAWLRRSAGSARLRAADLKRLRREYPRETLALGMLGAVGAVALATSAWSTPTVDAIRGSSAVSRLAPPAPPPLLVRELAPETAMAINRAIPVADGPNPAAKPFLLGKADEAARGRALECLTSAVYYEAASESADGQRSVAQVVLNRVRHPAFPASVCGVVYEGSTRATGCQFSFTCDGSLARRPASGLWEQARKIAWAALTGTVHKPVGNATHYHADYVVPYWASSLIKNAVAGAHIFYRWTGGWGRPAAFTQRYAASEPDSQALRMAAAEADKQHEAEEAVIEIPGAELLVEGEPKTDSDRVAIRFNLAARKAVEEAPKVPYVEKVKASDNLRWTLSGSLVEAQEKPLGQPKSDAPAPKLQEKVAAGGGSAATLPE
jgi:spore germination cell wall hydrolase CwlJ-like protein